MGGRLSRARATLSAMNARALLLLAGLAACGGREVGERPGVEPLHVLLFTVEGLRSDHVSALGYLPSTTRAVEGDANLDTKPGLDWDTVADRGVQFPNCMAPSLSSRAARVALFSGLSPEASGVRGDEDSPSDALPWLPEALRAAGFRTIACVAGPRVAQTSRSSRSRASRPRSAASRP